MIKPPSDEKMTYDAKRLFVFLPDAKVFYDGQYYIRDQWLTANAQIVERLETIYNRMDGEQDGSHAVAEGMEQLQQLIRELKA